MLDKPEKKFLSTNTLAYFVIGSGARKEENICEIVNCFLLKLIQLLIKTEKNRIKIKMCLKTPTWCLKTPILNPCVLH